MVSLIHGGVGQPRTDRPSLCIGLTSSAFRVYQHQSIFSGMAGLEIAGVVLGSIPLIISALEHYSDGVSMGSGMAIIHR